MKKALLKAMAFLLTLVIMLESGDLPFAGLSASAEKMPTVAEDTEEFIPVYTIEDLYNIRDDLDANYRLMNDIDLTQATAEGGDWDFMGNGWNPIGSNDVYGGETFTGIFDGDGHSIIGMRIEVNNWPGGTGEYAYLGLFARVSGEIRDLHMESGTIENTDEYFNVYAGSIAGYSEAVITGCSNTGSISSSSSSGTTSYSYSGGIAGYSSGAVSGCSNTGSISSFSSASDAYSYSYSGGIVGYSCESSITNCYNTGNVSSSSSSCAFTKSGIMSFSYSGGIGGYIYRSSVSGCNNTGRVSSSSFSSRSYFASIPRAYSYSYSGGIGGYIYESSASGCSNTGNVSSSSFSDYSAYLAVNVLSYAGGIAGHSIEVSISNCYNTGSVSSLSFYDDSSSDYEIVSHSYSGGIVGRGNWGSISECYNIGSVSSSSSSSSPGKSSYSGGIAGWYADKSSICNCYSRGVTTETTTNTENDSAETRKSDGYGIAYLYSSDCTITNGYYLTGTGISTDNHSTGAVSLTEAQMKLQSVYLGFDFDTVWTINSHDGYFYPQLRENRQTSGEHTFGDWQVRTPATCTQIGMEFRVCECGAEETKKSPPLGHSFTKYVSNQNATCTVDGTETAKCDRCDETDTRIAAGSALGHNYSIEWTVDHKPTCTQPGGQFHYCTRCGGKSDMVEIPPIGHSFTKYVFDDNATCTVDATETAKCDRCSATNTRVVEGSAFGHDYSTEWTTDKTPTCTEPGSKSHRCTRCGDKADVTEIPALGHSFTKYLSDNNTTCTADGTETAKCDRCSATNTRVIPALGHNYSADWTVDKAPTCTEPGSRSHHCSRCGDKIDVSEIPALGHSFTKYLSDNNATCTVDGTETAKCDRCDETDTRIAAGSALGHNYSTNWTVDKSPSCTQPGSKSHHCIRCGDRADITEIPATGHTFGEWVVTLPPTSDTEGMQERTCTVCGKTEQQAIPAVGAPDDEYLPGNVNGDGSVTSADALMALQAATDKIELTGAAALAADVNGDGSITSSDALQILQYATEKISNFSRR